jgi:HTH-type transcriptional regulator / antitoxin HigA
VIAIGDTYDPDYAVPPGRTLSEVIADQNISQKELATRTGLTEQTIIRILKGEQPITFQTANKLELVTGVPARMWNNLEMQYREQLSKLEEKRELEGQIEWVKTIPTRELITRGAIPECDDKGQLVRETLEFYGVSSATAWSNIWENPKVAARRSDCFETRPGAASAWIRLGELQAREITCKPYSKERFLDALKQIRDLTTEAPEAFIPRMRRLCAEAGVAVAIIKRFDKVPWNGATKWISSNKALILLSTRGKAEDLFWFSFFHEAYHVLYGKKSQLYIAEENSTDPEEQRADAFAADFLIPKRYDRQIRNLTSDAEVIELANILGVSPGIVAGRYRHLTRKWHRFKDLTRTFEWDAQG